MVESICYAVRSFGATTAVSLLVVCCAGYLLDSHKGRSAERNNAPVSDNGQKQDQRSCTKLQLKPQV
jgi:hypothetical protein